MDGGDYSLYIKARTILGRHGHEDNSPTKIFRNAAVIYAVYIKATKEDDGHIRRIWNPSERFFEALDYPSLSGKCTLKFNMSGALQSEIKEVSRKAELDTGVTFLKHAVRFYCTIIADEYYGWRHILHTSKGPKGGLTLLEFETVGGNNVIKLSDYIVEESSKRIAALGNAGLKIS